MPQPNQWAGFMGMQCALLWFSLMACAAAAFSSLPSWRPGIALRVAVILMAVTCSMAASYCGMRVDPARVRLDDLIDASSRWVVGAIFYLSFSAYALMFYLLPAFPGISAVLSLSLFSLSVGISAVPVIFGSWMAVDHGGGNPENASIALRHPLLHTIPIFFMHLSIVVCSSAAAAWAFGLAGAGIGAWTGVALFAWAGASTSVSFSQSTSATVRAIPPIAVLDSSGLVYAIRLLWRELYFDRHTTSQGAIIFIGLSTYAGSTLLFACGAAFAARLMSRFATSGVIFDVLLQMGGGVLIGLMLLVPKRPDKTAHLTDLEHLRMFDSLLTAVRTARLPVAEELSNALARWINRDADLPSAVLPEPRAIGKLESLLLLVRIARGVGEERMLARWRPAIVDSLRRIVFDGAVFVTRSRPSLAYTALAAQVIEEADLAGEIPLEPILDSITEQLELCMNGEEGASAEALASACRLLGDFRPPVELLRMQSLALAEYHLTRPIIRARLRELVAYIALLEDTALQDRLVSIVRARLWEALQLNPWNDVSLLLDCYLAHLSLGESDAPRLSLA
jgi:hypothetical protein